MGPEDDFFRQNEAKTLGQPGNFKNGRIWLKFGTLECEYLRDYFSFFENFYFRAWGRVYLSNYNWAFELVGKILKLSPVRLFARSTI